MPKLSTKTNSAPSKLNESVVHVVADSDSEVDMEVVDLTKHDSPSCSKRIAHKRSMPARTFASTQVNGNHGVAAPASTTMRMPFTAPRAEVAHIPAAFAAPTALRRRTSKRQRRATIAAASPASPKMSPTATVTQNAGAPNFFDTSLAKFLLDIGEGLVHEVAQVDLLRNLKTTLRKSCEEEKPELLKSIDQLQVDLDASAKKNEPFKFKLKKCEFCSFKSESTLMLANHYETPHIIGNMYKCNFCNFSIRSASSITNHMLLAHKVAARLEKPPSNNQCPNCPYEDNGKARLLRHMPSCAKRFCVEANQAPPLDWQPPALLPAPEAPKDIDASAETVQAMLTQAATQIAEFSNLKRQQMEQLTTMNAQNELLRGRPATRQAKANIRNNELSIYTPANFVPQKRPDEAQTPSVSIFPITKPTAATDATMATPAACSSKLSITPVNKPSSSGKATLMHTNCEICDMPIRTMEQLRKHMLRTHYVRIHPKCLRTQPPLSCLKCAFRFYSDQGLESHLLCIHGLVTSSMQSAAAYANDRGRCLLCGRHFPSHFVTHVIKEHDMHVRPAHLHYKCPICPATFELYKQFDEHARIMHRNANVPARTVQDNENVALPARPTDLSGNYYTGITSAESDSNALKNRLLLENLERNNQITIIKKFGPPDK